MTIIGLKTGDNGIQGLSTAHTHHPYPIPTPRGHHCSAFSPSTSCHCLSCRKQLRLSFLFLVLCFIIARRSPLLHHSLTPFKLLSYPLELHHAHTLSYYLLFLLSLTPSPLFFVLIFSKSCETSPHRGKSSAPAKSGSDITDMPARTHAQKGSSVKW